MTAKVQARAAIYTRFSRADGDSDSCDTQEAVARAAIEAQGWRLVDNERDDGISGREMVNRPGLNRALAQARAGAYDVLVCRDMDRLFRGDPARVLGILQQLQDHGIRVWEYLTRSFVEIDGANVIITAVKAHANRAEALKASTRIREKLRVRDEQGSWTGPAPYGFKNQRKKDGQIGVFLDRRGSVGVIVPDEKEHPILVGLPQMFFEFGSYNAVATELNRRFVRGPKGKPWEAQCVRKILQNPVYRGVVLRGRRGLGERAGSIVRVAARDEDVRRYDHPELKVWDDQVIAKVDALMAARARTTTWSPKERKHLASSFVRCPACGGSIVSSSSTRSGAASYMCSKSRSKACHGPLGYRSTRAVDAAVITACLGMVTDEVVARTREIIAEALDVREEHDSRIREQERLTREIAQAEKRARSYEEMAADAEGEERTRHRASLRAQLDRLASLREHLRELEARGSGPDPKALLASFDARVADLRATLAKGGVEAMPAVSAILQGQRLTADRRSDGRWVLHGEASPVVLVAEMYPPSGARGACAGYAEVGTNQKQQIHGVVVEPPAPPKA